MKKIYFHIAFWLAYLAQDVALVYLWDKDTLPNVHIILQLKLAIAKCSVALIPKMLFAYYLIYNSLPRILNSKPDRLKNVFYLVLYLIGAIFLYRLILVFFIYPVIYKDLLPPLPFFKAVGFLGLLMDIGFAAGAATVIKQIRLQLASKEKEKNLIRDKLETELKFLKNQTNPHFLFNTLNNIYALARKKSDDTADVVMKLSKLLRFMLYESSNEQISIKDEIRIIDDYIELEKIRYNERLTVSFLREVDNDDEQIAPLLLIPFAENAFKHGASESRFESFIYFDMKLQQGMLEFYIENTKESGDKKSNNASIGLNNVRRQLELMYKEHEISVQDEETVFKVYLKINLRSYADL